MDKVEGICQAVLNDELELELNLDNHRIPDLPASMYYIPNFITPALEAALLSKASLSRSTFASITESPSTQTASIQRINANIPYSSSRSMLLAT